MHPRRRHLDHSDLAFGLTRFACQSPFEQNEPGGRFRRQSLPPSAAHNRPLAHVDSQGGAKIEEKAFKRPVASWTYPGLKQTGNPPSWAPWLIWQGVSKGSRPLFFLINRVFGAFWATADPNGMAPTGAGLSGLPTCRQGAICPGLGAPSGVAACGHLGQLAGLDA